MNSSIHLAPYLDKKFEQIYAGDSYAFYRERFIKREKKHIHKIDTTYFSDKQIVMNALDPTKGSSNLTSAMMYFNAITDYMTQLRECLGELRDDIE